MAMVTINDRVLVNIGITFTVGALVSMWIWFNEWMLMNIGSPFTSGALVSKGIWFNDGAGEHGGPIYRWDLVSVFLILHNGFSEI